MNAFQSPDAFNFYYGSGPRVTDVRGFSYKNQDLTLVKNTKLWKDVNLQLRVEAFNVWNWHDFIAPGSIDQRLGLQHGHRRPRLRDVERGRDHPTGHPARGAARVLAYRPSVVRPGRPGPRGSRAGLAAPSRIAQESSNGSTASRRCRSSRPIKRVPSIDAFRGLVMFLMLAEVMRLWTLHDAFPSSGFWSIVAFNTTHVPWQGCSLHDLIQPAFSFLAGASLPFLDREPAGQGGDLREDAAPRRPAQPDPRLPRDLPALDGEPPDVLDVRGHAHPDRPRLHAPLPPRFRVAPRPGGRLRRDPRRLLGGVRALPGCRPPTSTTRPWACRPAGRTSTRGFSPTSTRTRTWRGRSTRGS